jgi:hypothetical protein
MLFRVWGGTNFRATKDLDLLGFVREESEPLRQIFVSICEQHVEDDGLVFDASSVRIAEIRDDQECGGFRLSLAAKLRTARVPIQVDVGIGAAITPAADNRFSDDAEPAAASYPHLSTRNSCR